MEQRMLKLLEQLQPAPRVNRLPVRTADGVRFIDMDTIDWIGADRDFVRVHAGRETHVTRSTMAEVEARLPRDMFLRVHRSIIVNLRRISSIEPWFKGDYVIQLHDGTKLRSGRTYRSAVQALVR
jgi:two-component system LytT family response regulator